MKKKIGAFGAGQFSLGTLAGGRPGTTIFQNPGGGGGGGRLGGVAYKDRARPPPRVSIYIEFGTALFAHGSCDWCFCACPFPFVMPNQSVFSFGHFTNALCCGKYCSGVSAYRNQKVTASMPQNIARDQTDLHRIGFLGWLLPLGHRNFEQVAG